MDLAAGSLDFDLTVEESGSLSAHLEGCPSCRHYAASLLADDALLRALPQRDAPSAVANRVRAAAAARHRLRPIVLLAAAFAVTMALGGGVLAGGALLEALDRTPAPTLDDAVPSPGPTLDGVSGLQLPIPPLEAVTWSRVADQPAFHAPYGVMESVALGGPGLVAVGDGCSVHLKDCRAAVWTSADGATWARVADGAVFDVGPYNPGRRGEMTDVAAGGPGMVAVGRALGADGIRSAAAWVSTDGLGWQRVPGAVTFKWGTMEAVVATPGRIVAVGSEVRPEGSARAAAWTSTDGWAWTRAADDQGATLDLGGPGTFADGRLHGAMTDLIGTSTGYLAVGSACGPPPTGGGCHGVAWSSPDGLTWTRSGDLLGGNPYALARLPSGVLVAVGDDAAETALRAWVSADGTSWSAAGPIGGFEGSFLGITAVRGGVVAVAANESHATTAFGSSDGLTWQEQVTGSGPGVMNGLTFDPSHANLVSVGWDGRTPAAAVWTGR